MTTIRVIDVETTGTDPEDEICEIAAVDVSDTGLFHSRATLVKPTIPIKVVARAIHHISDEDVKEAPAWGDVRPEYLDNIEDRVGVTHFAAHNAAFEERYIGQYLVERPMICTWKCAMRVWPDAPAHSNMVLRYWLNLLPGYQGQHHRALFDATITAHLLVELLEKASLEDLIAWSKEPPLYPKCPIGDWRGKPWREVETSFLLWILRKEGMEEDLKFNARMELTRRDREREELKPAEREAYVTLAKTAINFALSVDALNKWWTEESPRRIQYGIVKGEKEYDALVSACSARKSLLLKEQQADSKNRAASPTTDAKSDYANILAAG